MSLRLLKYPLFAALLFTASPSHAQRVGYIYSQEILSKMPEYIAAKEEIDHMANNWQKEIIAKQKELNTLKNDFVAERPLLTEAMEKQKMDQINELERELREFQNKRFGYQGMLYIKEQQLMEPVQQLLREAVQRMSKIKRVDFIFDLSADMAIPYAANGRNYTSFVMEQLNIPTE